LQLLLPDIENQTILEVACGNADFSISASSYASNVFCIDIVDSRLDWRIRQSNIHFEIMDASLMGYPNEMFDSVYLYNAMSHIRQQWKEIQNECKRVLKKNGKIYIIATWKMETALIDSMFPNDAKWNKDFLIAELNKT